MSKPSLRKKKSTQKNIRKVTEEAAMVCADILDKCELDDESRMHLSTFIAIAIEVFSKTDPAVFKECVQICEMRSYLLKRELKQEKKNG